MRWTTALVALAALLGSCAENRGSDTVLVGRADFLFEEEDTDLRGSDGGELLFGDHSLRSEDGATAILQATVLTTSIVEETVDEPCEQSGLRRQKALLFRYPAGFGEQAHVIRFAGNAIVHLLPESGMWVESILCYDELGSWSGTSGAFEDRSGSYRMVSDSLQLTLVLTDS
jgi:hypothetical protein